MFESSKTSRRTVLIGALCVAPTIALAQQSAPTAPLPTKPAAPPAAPVDVAELMAPDILPDVVVGKADAPVTMIEYASLTCGHCADFATDVYPKIKEKYIDAGKVKFILREFPLDPVAAVGFMAARCSGDKREAVAELLFAQQKSWAFVDKPLEALEKTLRQTGMSAEAFKKCTEDKDLYQNIIKIRVRGGEKFAVNSTPTFFINGERKIGTGSFEDFEAMITAALAKK